MSWLFGTYWASSDFVALIQWLLPALAAGVLLAAAFWLVGGIVNVLFEFMR